MERCSIACMDAEYAERLHIYPDSVNFTECPSFWKTQKVRIDLADYGSDFITNITAYAIVTGMD